MKKFIYKILVSLLLFFYIPLISTIAEVKSFTQGLYYIKDTGLSTDIEYKVRNPSKGRAVVIIFDSNQQMQEFLRLEPNSPDYNIKPISYGSIIIIIGGGSVIFS